MPEHSLVLSNLSIRKEDGEDIKSSTLGLENQNVGYKYESFEIYCHTCNSEFFAYRDEGFSSTGGAEGVYNFVVLPLWTARCSKIISN
ncbi:hypothetical protein [Pseudoalteromonas sp. UBA2102]|uniref:hypothetical protein n=1 Tax=Pseudoalteromonas sp. UBA2102 TaxID=1947291 RepID=UPI00258119F3|nr:hypothetical protein [Pseudoalteromonas sp. UBA2102]|tara:strand:+ start:199 stop:462 length:264 start_codon:yes stop_codon:yes gene_type:complete